MDTLERRYLREADYPRTLSSRPRGIEQMPGWNNWVVGCVLAAGAFCVIVMVWALNNNFGPYGATARLERTLAQLEVMPVIRPETALVVTRVMSQPGYDCEQVACDDKLTMRNTAVRARLLALVEAGKTGSEGTQIAASPPVHEIRSAY